MAENEVRHTAKGKVVLCGDECKNPTPTEETIDDGQKADHWVLSPEERAKGYIRPVRVKYKHTVCGTVTSMPQACAETYAVKPSYYGATWCCGCCEYLQVGEYGDFIWLDDGTKVGT